MMPNETQGGLFDDAAMGTVPPARTRDLAVTAQPGRVLSKAQQTFNRQLAKIEKLRAKLDRETRRMDAVLGHYAREIHPRLQRKSALQADLLRALAGFMDDKRLKGKRDRRALRELLADLLDQLAAKPGGLVAEDLQAIHQKIFGQTVQEVEEQDFETSRRTMEQMFSDLGVDIDFSDLHAGMSDAEVAAKMAGKFQAEDESALPPRTRPNKRAQARETREQEAAELRQKSIGSIYKQLAKVLHPDLEPNPAERERKVALMQELTSAYRAGDLHTLLRLELAWLHRAEADAARLSEDKLTVFNQVLRDQVRDLEDEIFQLPSHPRYGVLLRDEGPFFMPSQWTDSRAELDELDLTLASMEQSLAALRGPEPLAEVRGVISNWRNGGWFDWAQPVLVGG